MALINYATREINAKIVYYGPGLSGKTTNIQYVFSRVKPGKKGKLVSLATHGDRTLFFDFLPVELGNIKGFKTRFHLYTVPGQVYYNSTRKMVLKGTDGIVFVADSQDIMMDENVQSLENLKANLAGMGLDYESFPVVLQYNKRDLPNAVPVEGMNIVLNPTGLPWFEASAINGEGVLKTLTSTVKFVLHDLAETPHSHSLDFGAMEEAADGLVDGQPQFLAEGAGPETIVPEEADVPDAGITASQYPETASPEPAAEVQYEQAAEPSDADFELPEASPELFSNPQDGLEDEDVFDAEEVLEGDSLSDPVSYDTFPSPEAGTLDEVLRGYPSCAQPEFSGDVPGVHAGAPELPDEFHPGVDYDLASGLDLFPSTEGRVHDDPLETKPADAGAGAGRAGHERAPLRIKKRFNLPVRLSTKEGVREVVIKLNLDLDVTGEGIDEVESVEVMEPRPPRENIVDASTHVKDQSKHPPPAGPQGDKKGSDTTDPMQRSRGKGMLENMFGR